MANTPQAPTHPAGAPTPAASEPKPSVPGGMASDPAVAVANEIVSAIKGAMEKARQETADKAGDSLVADIAKTIRTFANNEAAKVASAAPPAAPNTAKK